MSEERPIDLRSAALARLRYEQMMGVETLAPVPLQRAAPAPVAPPTAATSAVSSVTSVSTRPAPAPAPASSAPAPVAAISPAEKDARWKALEARALDCTQCVLAKGRKKVVFGVGDRAAKLCFVGEAPGADEDIQGEPFVGKAGQLLNKIIGAMGLKRDDVYICNTVKCRPPDNRTPLPDEIAACNPFLVEQIDLVAPKVIVALGSPAAKTLLKTTQGIMSLRGRWHSYRNIPVMPTFHPAFLLRQYTEENRRAVWEDMKKVVERLK